MRADAAHRRIRLLALCCAALISLPTLAHAEWHLTPMGGATFLGNTTLLDLESASGKVHVQLGGAVTLVGSGLLGVEAVTIYTPSFFRDGDPDLVRDGRTFALMGNVVLAAPQRWTEYSLRPFVSGGFGLMRASQTDVADLFPVISRFAGYNIGAGAVGFLSERTGLRFDVRYYSSLNRPDQGAVGFGRVHLSYMAASVGFVIRR